MSETASRICALGSAVDGTAEECPGERCGFWEPGGAVVPGDCLLERLHVDLRVRGLAAHLLELRTSLEQACPADERSRP